MCLLLTNLTPYICIRRGKSTVTSGLHLGSDGELETLPAVTKPRTSHHRSPGGERRGKRKRWKFFLKRTREDRHQTDEHWNCFKGIVCVRVRWIMETPRKSSTHSSVAVFRMLKLDTSRKRRRRKRFAGRIGHVTLYSYVCRWWSLRTLYYSECL